MLRIKYAIYFYFHMADPAGAAFFVLFCFCFCFLEGVYHEGQGPWHLLTKRKAEQKS